MENLSQNRQNCVCEICFKLLSSKQNLKQHMNIHTGDKPYRCLYEGCENSYRHASQLSNHRLLHQQTSSKTKAEIDDFRAFISLVIQALGPNSEKQVYQVPAGIYDREDAILPAISKPQLNIKLPAFASL